MAALVAEAWRQDPGIFRKYADWSQAEGRYEAMSVTQIRRQPQEFIDTGWPLFLSSRKPQEEESAQQETDRERQIREGIGYK